MDLNHIHTVKLKRIDAVVGNEVEKKNCKILFAKSVTAYGYDSIAQKKNERGITLDNKSNYFHNFFRWCSSRYI